MSIKRYLILFLLLCGLNAVSQTGSNILVPFLIGQKYGFSDEGGNLIVAPKFDIAYPFFEGHKLSMAINNSIPMMINRRGKKVKNASSDYIKNTETIGFEQAFKYQPDGIAMDVFCLSDSCPKLIIFNKLDNKHLIDKIGELYFVRSQNKTILIDTRGKVKTKEFDLINHYVSPEIEYAITEDDRLKKYGLLNGEGEQVLECTYDAISYKGKGVFELSQSGQIYPFKLAYNADYKPHEIEQNKLDPNRVISRHDKKFGVSDSLRNIILTYEYKKLYPMGDDNYLFWRENSVGIVNPEKGVIVENLVKASVNGIIGNTDFVPYVPYTKNIAFLDDGEFWHLVNIKGESLIDNIEGIFVDFQKFAGNIAGIDIKGKIGIIDNYGKVVLDFKYDKIFCIASNNTFVVHEGNKWKWVDLKGRIIFNDFDDFKYNLQNYLMVKKFGSWFYINDKGLVFRK